MTQVNNWTSDSPVHQENGLLLIVLSSKGVFALGLHNQRSSQPIHAFHS